MSNTIIPAHVETAVEYGGKRTKTIHVATVGDKHGEIEVSQDKGSVSLALTTHDKAGRAYVTLAEAEARQLCRDLAKRLGLEILP